MHKPLLLLPAALLLIAATWPAPQKPQKGGNAASEPAKPDPSARAKDIYKIDCAICHNANGDGKSEFGKSIGVTSDWTDPKSLEGKSDQQLIEIIRKGKDKMPPEDASRAKDEEVRGLVQYIRTLSKDQPAPAAAPAEAPAPAPAPTTSPTTN